MAGEGAVVLFMCTVYHADAMSATRRVIGQAVRGEFYRVKQQQNSENPET